MYTSKVEDWLIKDFNQLKKEYISEDKNKYKMMYNRLIPFHIREKLKNNELNSYYFQSDGEQFLNHVHNIVIFVDTYVKITPYFYAPFDMEECAIELRQDPKFRDFTKFCFYLIDTIQPKS